MSINTRPSSKRSALLIAVLFSLPFSAHAASFDGPLPVKNQFPVFVGVNQPYLEPAFTQDSFTVGLSHSSVFVIESSPQWDVNMDMELTELAFRYKKDIPGLFEVGMDIPVLRPASGFMDGFLDWYHSTFGFPDYGRSTRPMNEFLYEVRKNNALVIRGEGGRAGFGDARLTLKRMIAGDDPVFSVMADVEFPTGDAKAGYGNGSVDTAVAVLMDKKLGGKFTAYANAGAVFPGDLKGYQTIPLRNFLYAGAAVEAAVWTNFSLLGQVWVQGSPFPETGIPQVDTAAVILSLGGRYSSGGSSFEFSLTEDPNTSGAPDFILNVSFKKKL